METETESRSWFKRRALAIYFVLALGISWLIELPLIASKQGWTNLPTPFALHYLAAYGPMFSAIFVTVLTDGEEGLKELLRRVTKWQVGWRWFFISTLSPIALFGMGFLVARLINGVWPDLRLLGQVNFLPYLGIGAPFLWLATFGFGEEIGWRGFALPRLQKTRTAASATLVLGLVWVLWHLPAFFYLDTYEKLGLVMLPGFAISLLCGAVVYTWIYNSTRGSILMVALWHALFNFFSASETGQGVIQIVMSAAIVIAGLVFPRIYGLENFSRLERQTL